VKPHVRRRNTLIEAVAALVLARLAVRLLRADRIVAWASRPPRRPNRFVPPLHIEAVRRAVEEIGSKPWMQAVCLPRALAAQAMLRRRGVRSRLCLGAARADRALAAHAWIELDEPLIVHDDLGRQGYTRLVSFG
jgi:hypothetical protein